MICIEHVSKSFGESRVLSDVSLTVPTGKTKVILGLSGSGKTVLMKHIIGLFKPDAGRILINGEDTSHYQEKDFLALRRRFGMVFQQAALFDSLTVLENVCFPLQMHSKLPKAQIVQQSLERLAEVGLEAAADKYPSELSGGMRKRVAIARALITKPSHLLYDEPTTGLDPITSLQVDILMKKSHAAASVTALVITHDVASALRVGDEVAVIHAGRIVEDCPVSALKASQQPFVRQFLDTWFGGGAHG